MAWELTGNAIGSTGGFLGTTDAQPLIIRTGTTAAAQPPERLRVLPDGKIGIGTATPQARLSVAGGGAVINNVAIGTDTSGVGYLNEHETVGAALPSATLRLQSPNGLAFHAGPTGATLAENERMTISPGGDVGIGKAPGATYKLDVAGAVNATDLYKNGAPLVSSQWADVPGGGISYTAANVGVGTATPGAAYKVDVAGVVNAADYHKNGQPLNTSQWTNISGGINYAGGNVGVGIATPSRKLHVQGSEVHSGGGGGGYSFGNRETAAFVESPGAGERWVWYASGGKARLWSGGDRLSVGIDGTLAHVVIGPGANGRIKTRHIDGKHWLNDNDDALHLNWGTGKPVLLGFGNGTKAALDVSGEIRAGNSDLYFTRTDHNHTGIGNATGWAAIENSANYGALMILGRAGTQRGRMVKLWDYLQVNGGMDVTGTLGTAGWPAAPRTPGWGGGIHTWDVEAEGTMWSQHGYKQGSDARMKTNVVELSSVLDKLEMIRGVSFEWIGKRASSARRDIGIIAQEVEKVFPELVSEHGEENLKAVDYSGLAGVLIEATKELKAKNEALSSRIESLERA